MKKFHVITGLPRAGSTLLCNILNQNPKFWASSTSSLCGALTGVSNFWAQTSDYKADLGVNQKATYNKLVESTRAFVKRWYRRSDGREVIFDKGRGWSQNGVMLKSLFPKAKIIVCVRDLRNVFASFEKQHLKTGFVNVDASTTVRLLADRYQVAFSDENIIGFPLRGIADLWRRQRSLDIFIMPFEDLAAKPEEMMTKLYEFLGEDYFQHDFKNVKNTSTDPDGVYLGKFPHKGCGKVRKSDENEWQKILPSDITDDIMQKQQWYNDKFGYRKGA